MCLNQIIKQNKIPSSKPGKIKIDGKKKKKKENCRAETEKEKRKKNELRDPSENPKKSNPQSKNHQTEKKKHTHTHTQIGRGFAELIDRQIFKDRTTYGCGAVNRRRLFKAVCPQPQVFHSHTKKQTLT